MTRIPSAFLNRRNFLATTGAAFGGTMIGITPGRAQDLYKVRMQLGWLASNGILGEIAADKMGYYADEGLSLEVVPGGPNIDGVASVASGQANLGSISSSPSLMLARSAGLPVKCIAAGYQKHPYAYFSLKKNPINTPQDMIGKTIGIQGTGKILLRALLAKNNIPEDKVNVLVIGADMAPLMTGQVDAISGWTTNVAALEILGDQRVTLSLWDAGIQLYANPFYVNDETLADHMDKVEAMLRVSARGWGYVHDNPEAAVGYLLERYPNLDKASELKAVPLVVGYSFDESTAKNGWGTMTPENWQAQIDIYKQLDQFTAATPTVDEVMTLAPLEATADARPHYG